MLPHIYPQGQEKELDRDIATTNSEDVSKVVSSGTSSAKSGGIDKDDIDSSDDSSTRHLEKVQETEANDKKAANAES